MLTLEKSIGLFVPSTEETDRPISSSQLDKRVNLVSTKFADLFGGYQAFYSGIGGYIASNGHLISEDSILVVSFCTSEAYEEHYSRILVYASLLCHLWSQETVSILDCFQKLNLISETDHIDDVTRAICSRLVYHHLLLTKSGNKYFSPDDSAGYYNCGYTIGLALHEEKTKELATV